MLLQTHYRQGHFSAEMQGANLVTFQGKTYP
nr:MAG TPA: hypothetical protein [Caudoviricetes sp.]